MANHYLYFIRCGDAAAMKIGISTDPERRMATLQTSNPHLLTLCGHRVIRRETPQEARMEAMELEMALHDRLDAHRLRYEWFALNEETRRMAQFVIESRLKDKQVRAFVRSGAPPSPEFNGVLWDELCELISRCHGLTDLRLHA